MKKSTILKIALVFFFFGIELYMLSTIISLIYKKDIINFIFCLTMTIILMGIEIEIGKDFTKI
jgi:hypothetical protein